MLYNLKQEFQKTNIEKYLNFEIKKILALLI